jgi:hypothetical protein
LAGLRVGILSDVLSLLAGGLMERLADLEGFMKVGSRPEWRRIRIAVREWPTVAEPFVPY